MSAITLRSVKGSELTANEIDANFINLNTDKAEKASPTLSDPTYTGTLTGSTGILNIGSGQVYKDASGNVGIGLTPTAGVKLHVGGTVFSQSPNTAGGGTVGAIASDYFSTPTYASTNIIQYDSATAGTTCGLSNIRLGQLYFINSSAGLIWANNPIPLVFANSGTERMRIDGSGNVGIGRTPTNKKFEVAGQQWIQDATTPIIYLGNTLADYNAIYYDPVTKIGYVSAEGAGTQLVLRTQATERMRIDSSGNLLVGKTAGSAATAGNQFGLVGAGYNESVSTNAGGTLALWYMNRQTSTGTVIEFRQASSVVGSISVTASATSFNPSSDIRLKDNITPITNGIERVSKLKPVDYTWKIDGTKDNGFIAQDLLKMPEFANRVNSIGKADDGSDLYGVDYMKFVSVLTAAIQELKAIIDTQQEQINSLLGK